MPDKIRNDSLVYLATPYSKYPHGIDRAFVEAARIAAKLLHAGVKVYSPIVHSHPLALHGGIDPLDYTVWLPFNEAMLDAAHVLVVAQMDGWANSVGIAEEIAFFDARQKPIFDLDPIPFVMTRRRDVRPKRERIDGRSDAEITRERAEFLRGVWTAKMGFAPLNPSYKR